MHKTSIYESQIREILTDLFLNTIFVARYRADNDQMCLFVFFFFIAIFSSGVCFMSFCSFLLLSNLPRLFLCFSEEKNTKTQKHIGSLVQSYC